MPQELSNPKISSTEFYLKEPSGMTVDYWDYDKTEPSISSYQAEIRGRKVYWHHQYKRDQKPGGEKRRVTVDLVKKGIRFSYKIYFENLNMKELSRLYWVLTVGQSAEHGHKIGLGKPLGLGSIVISLKDAW